MNSTTDTMQKQRPPVVLTIAGSDSGGGAGVQADLKTFTRLGVYGATVITAVTAQNTRGVQGVYPVPVAGVAEQLRSVLTDIPVDAIKIGMLQGAATVRAVVAALRELLADERAVPVVLDPVMVATSGDVLLEDAAVEVLRDELIPLATVITPNLHEARLLSGENISSEADMDAAADALRGLGCAWVLLKGGETVHGSFRFAPESSNDVLSGGEPMQRFWFRSERVETQNDHGTGCTLSSAIAAGLAQGQDVPEAVRQAKAFLTAALRGAQGMRIGSGRGAVLV